MKFRANLNAPVLVGNDAKIDRYVRFQIREVAKVWLKAALEIVPSWSGASRATFEALADAAGYAGPVGIGVSSTAPNRIALGRLNSTGGIDRLGAAKYQFYYTTTLQYLILDETTNVPPGTGGLRGAMLTPTPFMFRVAADAAAVAYVESLKQANRNIPLIGLTSRKIFQ